MFHTLELEAKLIDTSGMQIPVICRIERPPCSGMPIFLELRSVLPLERRIESPCQIIGETGSLSLEIKNFYCSKYRLTEPSRKYSFGLIQGMHADHLKLKGITYSTPSIKFNLSPSNFLSRLGSFKSERYSSTPGQVTKLFEIEISGIGKIQFRKEWSFIYKNDQHLNAEIYDTYTALIELSAENPPAIDELIARFEDVLRMLSVMFRQAVSILGWEHSDGETSTHFWRNPLEPHLPPYLRQSFDPELASESEFITCAESLINSFMEKKGDIKKRLIEISISIAPHLDLPTDQRFVSLFSVFERTLDLTKRSRSEKIAAQSEKRRLVEILNNSLEALDVVGNEVDQAVKRRIEGIVKNIEHDGLSFSAKLQIMREKIPNFRSAEIDLWPIEGKSNTNGLKNIRNNLAHSSPGKVPVHVLDVAEWHFHVLLERLVFVLTDTKIPEGIKINSVRLDGEWYRRGHWEPLFKNEIGRM